MGPPTDKGPFGVRPLPPPKKRKEKRSNKCRLKLWKYCAIDPEWLFCHQIDVFIRNAEIVIFLDLEWWRRWMSGFAAMSRLNIAISGLRQTQKGCGWQIRPISPASPIFEEIYICKLMIFAWFAFRNNQSNCQIFAKTSTFCSVLCSILSKELLKRSWIISVGLLS